MIRKLSPVQQRLLDMLPLTVRTKSIGYGWLLPSGITMKTIDALVARELISKQIKGVGADRRMELRLS